MERLGLEVQSLPGTTQNKVPRASAADVLDQIFIVKSAGTSTFEMHRQNGSRRAVYRVHIEIVDTKQKRGSKFEEGHFRNSQADSAI